jgi:hypothetical protein
MPESKIQNPKSKFAQLAAVLLATCSASASADEPLFQRDVVPILTAHCFKCHGLEASKSNLDLRTVGLMRRGGDGGPALVPGSLDDSPLASRVADRSMPPEGELPLSDEQIATVRHWVETGARSETPDATAVRDEAPPFSEADRDWWAFQKPIRPALPMLSSRPARTPVDAFVMARLDQEHLSYSPPADLTTLVRRVYFDLTGLPPSPEETAQFLGQIATLGGDATYERLVDTLLASPHFGERWGRHWLDVAGYADVFGSDNDAAIIKLVENRWLYRDYVVTALNDDLPFDRFLTEQIAGDELVDWRSAERFTPDIRRLLAATGYLRTGIDDTGENELNTALIRFRVLHLTLDVVGTGLMGLTVGCARCHSHKFDPIPQRDYYRLMALLTPAFNPQSWVTVTERHLPDVSPAEQAHVAQHNSDLDRRIEALKQRITAIEAAGKRALFERKLTALPEPIRADTRLAIETPAEGRNEVQKYLAEKLESLLAVKSEEVPAALNEADRSALVELNRQIGEISGQKRTWGEIFATYDVGPPPATFLLRRGDHEAPGIEIEPGFLSILCDDDGVLRAPPAAAGATSGRRLALARWMTDGQSRAGALVARVMVNRVWQHLFGEGIVATPENFGHAGAPPTYPELLEWLASEFVANGWKLKPLIRLLVLSDVYRQASSRDGGSIVAAGLAAGGPSAAAEATSDPEAIDPGNRLLWRMRLRRLEAEVVRDAILATSGKLDRALGGPPIPLESRPDGTVVVDEKKMPTPTSKWRRSLYILARRNYHLSLLNDFDQPALATNCTRRSPSAVVLQSLTLMNDAFLFEQAGHFADRVAAAVPGGPPEQQIDAAFHIALGRHAKPLETLWGVDLMRRQAERCRAAQVPAPEADHQALANLCHVLLATNEFLYVP